MKIIYIICALIALLVGLSVLTFYALQTVGSSGVPDMSTYVKIYISNQSNTNIKIDIDKSKMTCGFIESNKNIRRYGSGEFVPGEICMLQAHGKTSDAKWEVKFESIQGIIRVRMARRQSLREKEDIIGPGKYTYIVKSENDKLVLCID